MGFVLPVLLFAVEGASGALLGGGRGGGREVRNPPPKPQKSFGGGGQHPESFWLGIYGMAGGLDLTVWLR